MTELKQDMVQVQKLVGNAFNQTGGLVAFANNGRMTPDRLQRTLEQTADYFERATLELRKLCEKYVPGVDVFQRKIMPSIEVAGKVEQMGYGWLHITLNTLLPSCRYQPPTWLTETIRRLLDSYEAGGCHLPFFKRAMLIIDEHSAVEGRHIFDQDNKGWKAVSNAIKGRIIPDDDQYTLAVSLLSTKSETNGCHITLLPQAEAGDFFSLHSRDYATEDFYTGGWS